MFAKHYFIGDAAHHQCINTEMVLRIGAVTCSLFLPFLFAGFTVPKLPPGSKAIYRFEPTLRVAAQTQNGGAFSVVVGFERSRQPTAAEMLKKLAGKFGRSEFSALDVSVGRLYAATGEVVLNVRVPESSRLEPVKTRLLAWLAREPGIAFAGEPGKVRAE